MLPLDYYSYDVLGLANPLAAHLELSRRALPGHEKDLPDPWLIAHSPRREFPSIPFTAPAFERPNSVFGDLIPRTSGAELASQTRWARQALQCGATVRVGQRPARTADPFASLKNVAGSFTLTRLRVPRGPASSVRDLLYGRLVMLRIPAGGRGTCVWTWWLGSARHAPG